MVNPAHATSFERRLMSKVTRSDEELMTQLSEGDAHALEVLVERYQNDVFRFCLHYVKNVESAKEMAQEAFLRVYSARSRFDANRRFKPWLLCIARNLCLNEIKRKHALTMDGFEEFAGALHASGSYTAQPSVANGPDARLLSEERYDAMLEAISALPKEHQEVVRLRFFERLSAREIAEIVDSTEGAIRTRLHRILKQLRDLCAPMRDDL